LNAQFDITNAIVGRVWLAEKNCEEVLIKHNQHILFRGVRSKPLTSSHPNDELPKGPGSLHDGA